MAQDCYGGYVLAGGRSRRMGSAKALLRLGDRTLVEYIAEEVRAAAGCVVLVGCAPVAGLSAIEDLFPGFGPVGGLATALSHTTAEWNLVVACDMPRVDREHLRELLRHAESSAGAQAVVPVTADGRLHALCAVYHRSAVSALQQAVAEDIHTVREALVRLKTMQWPVTDAEWLANANTPEEWNELTGGLG